MQTPKSKPPPQIFLSMYCSGVLFTLILLLRLQYWWGAC